MTKPVPRIRKQKARRRAEEAAKSVGNNQNALSPSDSNVEEILPSHLAEREQRRRELREALQAQRLEQSRMNPKKKKRLDKYIDIKLKKDENLDLIKKLAAQQVDTSLLQSSKRLGRGSESKREKLARILQQKRAGIDIGDEEVLLWEKPNKSDGRRITSGRFDKNEENDQDDTEDNDDDVHDHSGNTDRNPSEMLDAHPSVSKPQDQPVFGSGLKRQLETDDKGKPVVQKRKRVKVQTRGWGVPAPKLSSPNEDSSDWEGFDSESNNEEDLDFSDESSDSEPSDSYQQEISESDALTDEEKASETDLNNNLEDHARLQQRASAFKSWALQLRNDAVGFVPSTNLNARNDPSSLSSEKIGTEEMKSQVFSTPQMKSASPKDKVKPDSLLGNVTATNIRIFNVPVNRSPDIEQVRLALPVVAEEQTIMEAVHGNDIVVLCGETGSGKTTQVPQFLFEAGYGDPESPNPGMIGVTQPRRVAAVSMSKRVAAELGDHGDKVSYQIRYDSTVKSNTAIKFMTDGVLIRETAQDFILSKYSVIVIDEAHERSVNTDILIGMLSRIVETRAELAQRTTTVKRLKVVIMSATLQTTELLENRALFRKGTPPIIQAEGRQHPVTIHFSKRTKHDYVEEMFQKVKKGHKKLPRGAMLVFLTGQNEISTLAKRLKQAFAATDESGDVNWQVRTSPKEAAIEDEEVDLDRFDKIDVGKAEEDSDSDAEILGPDNDEMEEFNVGDEVDELLKVHVLPLYSQLPTDQQMKVFQPPPDGSRLIVLATNVAETSLTIPDVRYVFDSGRAKEKRYDKRTGVQSFDVDWISKASANQRTGRAGRTAPGHCYRLYSSAVYERDFAEFTTPEILRTPIEGVILQLKSLGIPQVAKFPFPTAPDRLSLIKAEELLSYLGAIVHGQLTDVGKELVMFPLSPRLSRIICIGERLGISNSAITLVAALAVGDLFVLESQLGFKKSKSIDAQQMQSEEYMRMEQEKKEYTAFHGHVSRSDRTSDAMKLLTALDDFMGSSSGRSVDQFNKFARIKALKEAEQLRHQLGQILTLYKSGSNSLASSPQMPNHKTALLLNQVVAAGYIDQVAIRADLSPTPPETTRQPKSATDVPYWPLFPSSPPDLHSILGSQDDEKSRREAELRLKSVYIHPASVLAHVSPSKLPQYLVYSHLSRPSNSNTPETPLSLDGKIPKTRMHPLSPITARHIVELATGTPLLDDGKPIGKIEMLNRDDKGRERRRVYCVPFLKPGKDSGDLGWPLPPARRVIQRRERGSGWTVEKVEE